MTTEEYQELADLTDCKYQHYNRVNDVDIQRLLHAAVGLCTETGEFQDQLKRHIFYGKDLDKVNLKEELGDILWYVALACNTLDIQMSEVMEKNIVKLKIRYPEKFTQDKALNRNLEAERKVL